MDQSDQRFEKTIVTAIDFGSTYSGYTFRNYAEEPFTKIRSSTGSGKEQTLHEKTASSILFNPDKSFNSFGWVMFFYIVGCMVTINDGNIRSIFLYLPFFKLTCIVIDGLIFITTASPEVFLSIWPFTLFCYCYCKRSIFSFRPEIMGQIYIKPWL